LPANMGTLWIKRHAFWELFQAGVYLKSFSVEDNYVATPQCHQSHFRKV